MHFYFPKKCFCFYLEKVQRTFYRKTKILYFRLISCTTNMFWSRLRDELVSQTIKSTLDPIPQSNPPQIRSLIKNGSTPDFFAKSGCQYNIFEYSFYVMFGNRSDPELPQVTSKWAHQGLLVFVSKNPVNLVLAHKSPNILHPFISMDNCVQSLLEEHT